MTLDPGEFIRRFLLHVLPKGFHRIRHYGLLASAGRAANIALRPRTSRRAPAQGRMQRTVMPMPLARPIGGRHARAAAAG